MAASSCHRTRIGHLFGGRCRRRTVQQSRGLERGDGLAQRPRAVGRSSSRPAGVGAVVVGAFVGATVVSAAAGGGAAVRGGGGGVGRTVVGSVVGDGAALGGREGTNGVRVGVTRGLAALGVGVGVRCGGPDE